MKSWVRRVPVPLSGVMLGFAALGNFLKSLSAYAWICLELVAVFLLFLLLLKCFCLPRDVAEDMKIPAIAGAAGTFPMGVMFLSVSLASVNHTAGEILWWAALFLHAALILYFTFRLAFPFRLENVYTTWFLVYVGIVAASATAGTFGMQWLGRGLVCWGLAVTLILMGIITARYFRIPAEEPLRPLTAIYAAPVSLCLVGYLQTFSDKNLTAVLLLSILSHIFYIFGLYQVLTRIGKKFYPSFSGFTFPFINTAIATKMSAAALGQGGTAGKILRTAAPVECAVGMVFLLIVSVRYLGFIFFPESRKISRTAENKFVS